MNKQEYNSLTDIIEKSKKKKGSNELFAETYCDGKVIINDPSFNKDEERKASEKPETTKDKLNRQIWSYLIQDKLGDTMENILFEKNEPFSEKTVI